MSADETRVREMVQTRFGRYGEDLVNVLTGFSLQPGYLAALFEIIGLSSVNDTVESRLDALNWYVGRKGTDSLLKAASRVADGPASPAPTSRAPTPASQPAEPQVPEADAEDVEFEERVHNYKQDISRDIQKYIGNQRRRDAENPFKYDEEELKGAREMSAHMNDPDRFVAKVKGRPGTSANPAQKPAPTPAAQPAQPAQSASLGEVDQAQLDREAEEKRINEEQEQARLEAEAERLRMEELKGRPHIEVPGYSGPDRRSGLERRIHPDRRQTVEIVPKNRRFGGERRKELKGRRESDQARPERWWRYLGDKDAPMLLPFMRKQLEAMQNSNNSG